MRIILGIRRFILFTCLIASLVILPAFTPLKTADQPTVVRVGVYQNEPKVFIDENGNPSGFFIDLIEKIAVEENWMLVFVPCEWSVCLQALANGEIDLMPDVAYSKERDELFDFHKTPVIESWSSVYSSPGGAISTLADLKGKRIAVLDGSIQQTIFQELMSGFGYEVTIIPAKTYKEAFSMAEDGSADGAISNQLFGDYFYQQYHLEKTSIDFNPAQLFFAAAQGKNAELLNAIDRDLTKWKAEPNSPYYSTLGLWTAKEPYRLPKSILWAAGIVLGLFVAAAGGILLLRRQVRLRTLKLSLANQELQKSEKRYQTLANISPVGIFRTDPDGSTTYVNPKWSVISGLPAEKALGDGWLEAVHPDDRDRLAYVWKESAEKHQASYSDYRFLHPDGRIVWVMGQAVTEYDSENQIMGYVGTITDITERKLAEQEIAKLNTELESRVKERTAQLEAMNKELESFSYSVSHDLRAPLRAVSGFAEIIARRYRQQLNPEAMHYFDNIVKASERMGHLIDDLLTYARLGRSGVRHELISIESVVNEIQKNMRQYIDEIHGILSVAENLPSIFSDQTLLIQIFTNLLENAFKYHRQDVRPLVSITCEDLEKKVLFRVEDNGIGIPQEYLEKIFNMFQRLHSEDDYPGTGIGLATVKKSVSLLGGSVWVESEVGKGSTFFVQLPKE